MINSPVLELQALARNRNSDIIEVLLTAKMIAVKLGLKDLSEWIEYEIDGYPGDVEVPEYRSGQGIIRYWNPYNGWQNMEFRNVPASVITTVQTFTLGESISSMQEVDSDDGMLRIAIPPHLVELILKGQQIPSEICWFFSANKLKHIVTTVRNKILNWALELESQGILGMGLLFTQNEKDAAPMTVNNTNIFNGAVNNAGAIGAGNSGSIEQHNPIEAGDFSSLVLEIKKHGFNDEDLKDLRRIVDESPAPATKGEIEQCFSGWIGAMTVKALKGGLNIAGVSAPEVLTNALCDYFKISAK
ncbi:abortive phage resistance protein [Enterobacter hormaechei]|uniref:AbiTii domain-containing protein n=1 Tax=Enterobacter hormaechei TaxID=158836 RepID=UPI002175BEF4|nr:abortive phage resistance protein [Enterobacter hormaechei]UVZ91718.1 abortive phage resistance protein [Enterobacter hormaechei]